MFLKGIEVYGFKSFADKIELEFEPGITAVVGPNGSGKSNVSDAVRWVLGEQSAKNLRGGKMEDIIFAGTQKRKPLGYAEVSLIIDNSLGKLPIDYEEVRITRRIFRSGESEFYINKSSCRLKDIHQLFMDTGLGKEGYSIIGQGKIDEILNASSQDRRYIFEEAAGIVKYKSRKNDAEKKLDKTEQNLLRINDIIQELENQIEPLSAQAEKAKEFLSLKEQLKEKELALFIYKMDNLKEKQDEIQFNKHSIEEDLRKKEKIIEKKEGSNNQLKIQLKSTEETMDSRQQYLYDLRSKNEKNDSDIQLLNNEINNLRENEDRLEVDINEIKENIIQYSQEKQTKEKELDDISTYLEKQSTTLLKRKEELGKLKDILKDKESNIEEKRQQKFESINNLSDLKSNLNGIQVMEENIKKQLQQLKEQDVQLKERLKHQKSILQKEKNKEELNEQVIKAIRKSKKSLDEELNKVLSQLKSSTDKIEKHYKTIQSQKSRLKVLVEMENEYDGYYKSVKNLMSARDKNKFLKENIYGVVAELIKSSQQYTLAIERALGSSIQNIVVKDEFVAQESIKILSENKWGRATFLPLNIIKGKKIVKEQNILKETKGFIGIASDLVEYDPRFSPIIHQLLGRVVIVETMEAGIYLSRKLNQRFKIVTLEGDVFNPGGSIVGGRSSYKNSGILSRQQEIETLSKKIHDFKKQYEKLSQENIRLKNQKENLQSKEKELIEEMNKKELEKITLKNSSHQINSEVERIENEIARIQNEVDTFDTELEELQERKKLAKSNIVQTNQLIDQLDHEINTKDDISKNEKEKIELLNSEITHLEIDLAKNKQKKIEIQNQLIQINTNIKNSKDNLKKQEYRYEQYGVKVVENKSKIQELKACMEEVSNTIVQSKQQIDLLSQKRKKIEREIQVYEEELREHNKQLVLSNNALHKIEIQLNKVKMEMDTLQSRIYEDYKLTYNLALGYKRNLQDLSKINSVIRNFKNQIEELGNVNIDSIEEYTRISERYEFLSKQRDDLNVAKDNLHTVIHQITITMQQQFQEQFDMIKKEFSDVFQKLFQGGHAKVYLTDPENALNSGVEIEVQPPGKKLQNLSLLSGGERALTAIALLFSILKVRPTPFCILDEIEAALDDANVYRYANFLRGFSKDTQFIAITHRKGTMESADALYGITMEEQGVSKLVAVKINELAS